MTIRLYWGSASPFVRKVMVCAHELGLADRIETLDSAAHPVERDGRIKAFNPLAKVPAAQIETGETLFDSRVICEWLDHEGGGALFPAPGPARWRALRRQALADGLLDAMLLVRYEDLARTEGERSPRWREKQIEKASDALSAMAADLPAPECADIGAIAYGCALGWIDFRFPDLDWRQGRAGLADWLAGFETRPAMIATRPFA